jgi:hypothetical protein
MPWPTFKISIPRFKYGLSLLPQTIQNNLSDTLHFWSTKQKGKIHFSLIYAIYQHLVLRRSAQIFQKFRSRLKILGANKVT